MVITCGVPRWLSWVNIQLLILALVTISQLVRWSPIQATSTEPGWDSLLSLPLSPSRILSLSLKKSESLKSGSYCIGRRSSGEVGTMCGSALNHPHLPLAFFSVLLPLLESLQPLGACLGRSPAFLPSKPVFDLCWMTMNQTTELRGLVGLHVLNRQVYTHQPRFRNPFQLPSQFTSQVRATPGPPNGQGRPQLQSSRNLQMQTLGAGT